MSAYKSILLSPVAALLCCLAQCAAASQAVVGASNDSAFVGVSAIAADKLQAAQARLARMQKIADRFSGEAVALGYADNAWRFELVNHLMRADPATIGRVEAATDLRSALQAAAS